MMNSNMPPSTGPRRQIRARFTADAIAMSSATPGWAMQAVTKKHHISHDILVIYDIPGWTMRAAMLLYSAIRGRCAA